MRRNILRLLLLSTVLVAPQLFAAPPPKATWSPAAIDSVVYAGETTSVDISVELTQSAEYLDVWVAPELRPYVSISPIRVANVLAGEQISFELQISIDNAAEPKIVDGTVHLRSAKRTIARTLPVNLKLQWPSVAGPGGVVVTYPGTVNAEVSADSDSVLLWDKSAPPSVPESDDAGFISIIFLANLFGEPIGQIFDGNPGDDLGDIRGAVEVDERTGFEYRPIATLGGDRVVVVPTASGFVQFSEIGSAFESNGPFDQVLKSVEIPD